MFYTTNPKALLQNGQIVFLIVLEGSMPGSFEVSVLLGKATAGKYV